MIFASTKGKIIDVMDVLFENVRFVRAVNLPKNGKVEMVIVILKDGGYFEVSRNNQVMSL